MTDTATEAYDMNVLNDFISYLEDEVKRGSIYVLGGQGQRGAQITEQWIKSREKDQKNAERAIKYWKKQLEAGYNDLGAFDCSGLGMYYLCDVTGLLPADLTANGMKSKCTGITRQQVCRGDWVFMVTDGRATHIGYVVDDAKTVIEARGRDYGVCKTAIDSRPWNYFGRPEIFRKEIEAQEGGFTTLNKGDKGDSVKALQCALIALGYDLAKFGADGSFGGETQQAVKALQRDNSLEQDGIAKSAEADILGLTDGYILSDAIALLCRSHIALLKKHRNLLAQIKNIIEDHE